MSPLSAIRLSNVRTKALAAGVALTAVPLALAGALPSASAATAPVKTSPAVIRPATATSPAGLNWLDDQESPNHTWTQADAVAQAQRFNLISALPATYVKYVPAMKAANPNLQIVVYMNGAMASASEAATLPESYFLHDANGRRVTNSWGLSLMDIGNAGWIANRAAKCAAMVKASGYDGCFLDNLGSGTWYPGMVSAQPIDPTTGLNYTAAAWLPRAAALANSVRATTGKLVMANGLVSGPSFFNATAPSSVLLNNANVALAETFIRTAGMGITQYRSLTQWKQDVDMVAAAAAAGQHVAVLSKVWVPGTQQQIDGWHAYALASFLLGTDMNQSFEFSTGSGTPIYNGDSMLPLLSGLGTPVGPYTVLTGGVYQRNWTGGQVLVNPTTLAVTVPLSRTFTDPLTGAQYTGTVTLQPHSGQFLVG